MKKRWQRAGKIIPALFLLAIGSLVLFIPDPVFFRTEVQINRYIEIARELNIKNVVSAIYLGPRLIDTVTEVLIVVATVFGMMFIRRSR